MKDTTKEHEETKEPGDLVQDVYAYLSEHVIYLSARNPKVRHYKPKCMARNN